PSLSYRMFTPGREITIFDRFVNESPLTVSGTTVRSLHYLDDRWRIHAGTTAYAAYQSFLLPVQRERVFGAGYAVPLSAASRLTRRIRRRSAAARAPTRRRPRTASIVPASRSARSRRRRTSASARPSTSRSSAG